MANKLKALARHGYSKSESKPYEISRTYYISKLFRVHWPEVLQNIPSKLKASCILLQAVLQRGANNPAISG